MNLTQVSKHLPDGIRALSSLLNMLFAVAAACKVSARYSGSRDFSGIVLDGAKYSLGLTYAHPEQLSFRTCCQIDGEKATRLAVGDVTEEDPIPGGCSWSRSINLDSEPVHFFSRSKVDQIRWLEAFLRECLTMGRSIEVPNQPPPPEEPEET
jgi:hypothetical protein